MNSLLPWFLGYFSGIVFSIFSGESLWFSLLVSLSALGLSVYILYEICGRRWQANKLLVLAGCLAFGLLAPGQRSPEPGDANVLHHLQESQRAIIKGVVAEPPKGLDGKISHLIDLSSIQYAGEAKPVTGRARINFYGSLYSLKSLKMGDRVRIKRVRLKQPRNLKNPGGFDYARYLRFSGIQATGGISKSGQIEVLGHEPPPFYATFLERVRAAMLRQIDRNLQGETAALVKALALGERRFLSEETYETFKASGLAHLLAVSGLHLGVIAGAAFFIIYPIIFKILWRWLPRYAHAGHARKWTAFLCLLCVLFYGMIVGLKISALRAGLMVFFYLAAILLNRNNTLFQAFLLAAFAILLCNPQAVVSAGFQLSFSAVLFILLALKFVDSMKVDPVDRMGERSRFYRFFYGTAVISLAAYLGTLPFLIFHFHQISLIGVLANLVAVPFTSIVLPPLMAALAVGLVWEGLGDLLLLVLSGPLSLLLLSCKVLASFPYASAFVPTPPKAWLPVYYFLVLGVPWFIYENHRLAIVGSDAKQKLKQNYLAAGLTLSLVMAVVWLVWPRFPDWKPRLLTVAVLDVGQGESIFIEFPDRQTLLVDGGGFYKNSLDVGKAVLAPFLWDRGIRKLDYILATHSDQDHISGLESLVRFFPVGHYLDLEGRSRDPRIFEMGEEARRRGIPQVFAKAGGALQFGEVHITPLHPNPDFIKRRFGKRKKSKYKISNNRSVVLRIDYKKFSMLLAADVEREAEEYLLERGAPLDVDVLKAPHHGSRYSSTADFIAAASPEAVVFSSGYLNGFGHPHRRVVDDYRRAGAQIWRTDRDGAVFIETDGESFKIRGHGHL